jgi:hypothetical protein
MRGRFWVAALAAASPILLFDAVIGTSAFAQATAAAEDTDDPNAGGIAPADQSTKPDTSMLAPADPAPVATSPGGDAGQPGETPPATTTVQTVSIPAAAMPIVESIRAKLADPAVRRNVSAEDIAAAEAFYNGRSEPVWMTDMGFARGPGSDRRDPRSRRLGSESTAFRCLRPASFRLRWMSRRAPRSSSVSPF